MDDQFVCQPVQDLKPGDQIMMSFHLPSSERKFEVSTRTVKAIQVYAIVTLVDENPI